MTVRRRLLLGILCSAIIVAALVAAFWKPLLIAHHRREMISTRDRILAGSNAPTWLERVYGKLFIPDPFVENWGLLGHHDYHVSNLLRLGVLEQREFTLKNIVAPSDEAFAIWQQVMVRFPNNIDCHYSAVPSAPAPMQITVIAAPEQIPEWEAFFAERDVPDFRSRFMQPHFAQRRGTTVEVP